MLTRLFRTLGAASLPIKVLVIAGIVGVILVGLAASPLFFNTRVDEEFAGSAPVVQPTAPAITAIEPTISAPTAIAEAPVVVAEAPVVVAEAPVAPTIAPTVVAEAPAVPVALSSGSFTRVDAIHAAEGSATIYRTPEGELVLRLEEFASTNGPDLYVALSGHPMPRSSDEAHDDGYVEIARLKANQGNQNYVLPAGIDLSAFKSVVIYCRAFSVVFSTAELTGLSAE